jgi:phage terminase small subunit
MAKARPLTPKQQRFVAEYLLDLNGAAAARRAGYAAKNAGDVASQLLSKTQIAAARRPSPRPTCERRRPRPLALGC